jgi:hypothetical protein
LPICGEPRKECRSLTASVSSVGYFKTADTTWVIYRKKGFRETVSGGTSETGYVSSSSATYFGGTEYDQNFSGNTGGGEECPSWAATESDVCESSGTLTITVTDDGVTQNTFTRNRSDVSGDVIPGSDPEEEYPPCTFKDIGVFTDMTVDPPDVTTTEDFNGAITTFYVSGDDVHSYTETWELGTNYADWVAATRAAVLADLVFPADAACVGTACGSSQTVDPEPEAPEPPGEFVKSDIGMSITKAERRYGVPEGFSTVEAPRTVYEIQFDVGSFQPAWLAWKALADAHEAWEAEDPETRGPEPEAPGTEPTRPVRLSQESWEWGGDMEDPWSTWFTNDPPEDGGVIMDVNMMVICSKSAKRGMKPTAVGPVHVFDE